MSICASSFLPECVCFLMIVPHGTGQPPLWGPAALLLAPSPTPNSDCLAFEITPLSTLVLKVPRFLLSAFPTPLHSLSCVLLSKKRTVKMWETWASWKKNHFSFSTDGSFHFGEGYMRCWTIYLYKAYSLHIGYTCITFLGLPYQITINRMT